MLARIYKPARNAMQSGKALLGQWILEFAPAEARRPDPLMGWPGSADTQTQVNLRAPGSLTQLESGCQLISDLFYTLMG